MKKFVKHIEALSSGTILSAATALLLTMAAGCVAEDGECPVVEKKEDMCVSLCISGALNASTRADEQPLPSALGEEEGTIAESYINIEDLYVLAFKIGEGKDVVADGNSVLKDIIWPPKEAERLKESQISSNGTDVYLTTFLSSENYAQDENFSIVVIANTRNWLNDGESFTLEKSITKLSDLQKVLSYSKAIGAGKNTWAPSNVNSDGIPLFGILRTNLEFYNTKINNSANPYGLGTILLLRTLAKVEIMTSADSNLTIQSAEVIGRGWNSNLQLIPFTSSWTLNRMENYLTLGNTGQVNVEPEFDGFESPSASTLSFTETTVIDKGDDGKGNTTVPAFVAYLPEYMLAGTFDDGTNRNNIIRIRFEGKDKEFNLQIAPHNSQTGQIETGNEDDWQLYWKYLLRNYYYRFRIKGIQEDAQEESLTLEYTVCPMDNAPTIEIPPFN